MPSFKLQLFTDDQKVFSDMIRLSLGSAIRLTGGLVDLIHLGRLEDFFQID